MFQCVNIIHKKEICCYLSCHTWGGWKLHKHFWLLLFWFSNQSRFIMQRKRVTFRVLPLWIAAQIICVWLLSFPPQCATVCRCSVRTGNMSGQIITQRDRSSFQDCFRRYIDIFFFQIWILMSKIHTMIYSFHYIILAWQTSQVVTEKLI